MRMSQIQNIILAVLCVCGVACAVSDSADNKEVKRILMMSGGHEECKWFHYMEGGMSKSLGGHGVEIELYQEFLDWRRMGQVGYAKSRREIVKEKYKDAGIDAVVLVGGKAYEFVKNNLTDSFVKDIPVVYCPSDGRSPVLVDKYVDDYVREEKMSLRRTIELAKQFGPDLRGVVVVADKSAEDFFMVDKFRKSLTEYAGGLGLKLSEISGSKYDTNEMLKKVSEVKSDNAIILIRWARGKNGDAGNAYQICREIVKNSKVPVYAISSDMIGEGVVGGNVISASGLGEVAGEILYCEFESLSAAKGIEDKFVCCDKFDLRSLLVWDISISAIPAGAEIYDEHKSDVSDGFDDVGLTAQEIQWLNEEPEVKVALLPRPPLVIDRKDPKGFAVDYIELLSSRTGLKLRYDNTYNSIKDCLSASEDGGGVDVIIGMEDTVERHQCFNFTEPWLSMYFTLFVQEDCDMIFYSDLESLAGKRIAVEDGSRVQEILKSRFSYLDLLSVDDAVEGMRKVAAGEVFGWLGDHAVGLYVMKSFEVEGVKVGATYMELGRHNLSIAVRKDKKLLFGVLNKVSGSVTKNEIDSLRQSYSEKLSYEPGVRVEVVVETILIVLVMFAMVLAVVMVRFRRAGRQVRESEENLQIAFESIADAVIVTDVKGEIQRCNRIAEKLTGKSKAEVVGELVGTVFDIVDPVTMKDVQSPIEWVNRERIETGERQAALVASSGKRYYISYNASPVFDKGAELEGMVLIFRDITDGYELDRRMKRAEKERELILENITVGVCFYDEHFSPLRYNKQMEESYGDLITDNRVLRENMLAEGKIEPGVVKKFSVSCQGSPGKEWYELEVTGVPVIDGNEAVGVLEVVVDVTQYRRLQQELEDAYSELRQYSGGLEEQVKLRTFQLQDRNDQLNMALNELKMAQGKLILSEKMAALGQLISGIAHEINTPLGVINASVSVVHKSMKHLVESIGTIEKLMACGEEDEAGRLLSRGIVHIRSGGPLSTRQERELREQLVDELAAEGIEENSEYIATCLLGAGVSDSWREYLPLLKHEKCLDVLYELSNILSIATSCTAIVSSVDSVSRIVMALKSYVHKSDYRQDGEAETSVFNMVPGLENVLVLFESRLKERIVLEFKKESVPGVKGNPDELNQVWTNLIQNSIQAMPEGGNLEIEVKQAEGGVDVRITDSGCGMSKEVKGRMFEPLFTTKSPGEGTGLGMDIVLRIVEDNFQGRVEVESEEGKGTTVSIWLPGVGAEH